MELLIASGANIHATTESEKTALHVACQQGSWETAQAVLHAAHTSPGVMGGLGPLLAATENGGATAIELEAHSLGNDAL